MSLAHGRPYLAIPGPSVMPDRVLQAMHRPAPNIYEGALPDMMPGLMADLARVAGTAHHVAMYICNGHGMWEAVLANVLRPGDAVLVPATGHFSQGWAEVARTMGAEVRMLEFGNRASFDQARVTDALAADKARRIKAVLATHVDTSSTVRNDIGALRAALDAAGHPALLMADCVASMGCDRFEMDALGADVAIAASQKGLMTPPGLGFAFFNDRAEAARDAMGAVSPYWDWRPRAHSEAFYQYFGGTAPTHHLYGLRAALDMIGEEGLEAVWARHETLARAIWAAAEAWGQGGPMELNAPAGLRSHAVTALRLGGDRADRLRAWCAAEAGVTLGIGLGLSKPGTPDAGGFFRIGHMGHVNAHMVLGALAVIQAGLKATGTPHGPGALDAAAAVCAGG